MNQRQLDEIPDEYLREAGTRLLRAYLGGRGWRMSLAELDAERRTRSTRTRLPRRTGS